MTGSTSGDALWQRCAASLRSQVSEGTWNTWFAHVHALEATPERLTLSVPNSLVKERIETRFLSLVRTVMAEFTGIDPEVVLTVASGTSPYAVETADRATLPRPGHTAPPPPPPPGTEGPPASSPDSATRDGVPSTDATGPSGPSGPSGPPRTLERTVATGGELMLNPRYTFEDFVIGTSNRFAHAAAMSVAERPARSYNPLFIYGDSGLGKTHLLQAIAHYVRQNYAGSRVRYVSTETFVSEFVDAIRSNTAPAFKRRYRDDCDVLLIDDIQFMEGKEGTQEEFFHTFNFLHQSGRQVVISSDRPPKSIATLEDRLRSRFEWGLITDIQPPELETRLAILSKKAERERTHVPDEVLNFIATHLKDNIRELEGALNRVCAYAGLNRVQLDLAMAERVLTDLLSGNEPRLITAQVILKATAEMFGFAIEELCGQSRRRPLVTARQVGMYAFRELTDYSYPMIGREFGNRDHTTVIHAVEKITGQMKERRAIYDQVSELIRVIKTGG